MLNPYTPPESETSLRSKSDNNLLFVWIWLPLVSLGAILIAPAEIISVYAMTLLGLIYFLSGTLAASGANWLTKVVGVTLVAGATWYSAMIELHQLVFALVYFTCNVLFGVKSCRDIPKHRGAIFGTLAACFLIGLPIILIGPAVVSTVGIILIDRYTRKLDSQTLQ